MRTVTHTARSRALRGFTALEVMLAIGLMAATAGITIPMYRQYQVFSDLDTAAEHLVQATRAAQALSEAGKLDSVWGVSYVDGTLFAGESYAERNDENDVGFPLPASVDTDGLSEVVFSRVDGLPNATGTVCIYSTVSDGFRTLTIDRTGVVTVSGILYGGCSGEILEGSSGGDSSGGATGSTTGGVTAGSTGGETSGTTGGETSGTTGGETAGTAGGTTSGTAGGETSGTTGGETSGTTGGSDSSSSSSDSSDDSSQSSSSSVQDEYDTDDLIEDQEEISNDDVADDEEDDEDATDSCDVRSTINRRSRKLVSRGSNDVRVKVLGSDMRYGNNGPKVDVRLSASTDDGGQWTDLFGGRGISASDQETLLNVADGASIVFRVNGRYSWLFNKTYRSDGGEGRVYMLKNGDTVPGFDELRSRNNLESYLRERIDAEGRVSIGANEVLVIVEMGALESRSSKFQSAVLLLTFSEKLNSCAEPNSARVRLSFRRVENQGTGNLRNDVYVGSDAVRYREQQWIPLRDRNGDIIVDGGIDEDVRGIAVERGNGWIRIVQHGSHTGSSGKEIADVKVRFNHAWINSIVNEVDLNASENPTDGITNDTDAGDEFVDGPTRKSMFFFTRATTTDDGVILYWTETRPSGETSSVSSSSSSSSSSSVASVDPCAVPFTVSAGGMLTIDEAADVTVRIIGSESTYGERGPRVSVRSTLSFDGGNAWERLFGYRALRGSEIAVYRNVPGGSRIVLSFNARYSWLFNKTVQSGGGDSRLRVLTNGQSISGLQSLIASGQARRFVRNLTDSQGRVTVNNNDVVYFLELMNTARPQYRDAVAVISIDRPSGYSCGSSSTSSVSTSSTSSSSSSSFVSSYASSPDADADNDSVRNADDWCPFDTVLPESVPTEYMSFDRLALTDARGKGKKTPVFKSGPRKQVSEFTIKDTHGCSCAQLLDAIEDRGYHTFDDHPTLYRRMKSLFSTYVTSARKYGCSESLLEMVAEEDRDHDNGHGNDD